MHPLRVVLLTVLLTPTLAAAATANAARPEPGCRGLNFTDPSGDSPRADTDLVDGFLTTSEGTVVYHVRLASLPADALPGLFGVSRVYVRYSVGRAVYGLKATIRQTDARFEHASEGGPDRESSGAVYRGTPAVVSFKLPGVPPGATVSIGEVRAAPGVDVPDDDVATGSAQATQCPPPPPPADPPPPGDPAPAEPAPAQPQPVAPPERARITFKARRLRDGRLRITGRVRGKRLRRVVIRGNGRVLARRAVRRGRFSATLRGVPRGTRLRVVPAPRR